MMSFPNLGIVIMMSLLSQLYSQVVPYSDHSSFPELLEFVRLVRPRSVRPIVRSLRGDKNSITSLRCDMSVFSHLLDPTPQVSVMCYEMFLPCRKYEYTHHLKQ